ncbi:hypothetical protein Mal15_19060 [Stieleria maiorica]|uniref:Uncharacterized protein n=1 Tax=Stieleria maiorica TaxID=2795974 RepID=A0A5B9MD38_9BACT|nr:hypothetical protein [Stieleria maiorica]QEF97860.1 hypothetical protein Mal15_19060 [Stieleria maiorica]
MGKRKKSKRTTTRSAAEYSFAEALSFAKKRKLDDWTRLLSKNNGQAALEAGGQFADLQRFHREVRSAGGVREVVSDNRGYAGRFHIASQLLALKNDFVVSTVSGLNRAPLESFQLAESLQDLKLKAPGTYPGRLFHAIMSNLLFPDGKRGPLHLIDRAGELTVAGKGKLKDAEWTATYPEELRSIIGCDPLVWLLTQYKRKVKVPPVSQKMAILLSGTDMKNRELEQLFAPRKSKSDFKWPSMNQHDQADLISYLISGISRLFRSLGFSGLVLALEHDRIFSDGRKEIKRKEPDPTKRRRKTTEFERDMRTCFGALIWAAVAPDDIRKCAGTRDGKISRTKCCHGELLKHTGGPNSTTAYPFTTTKRCHLGVLYSTTPKNEVSDQGYQMFGRHNSIVLPS